MTESDFKDIGVASFGERRRLTIAIKSLTSPPRSHQSSASVASFSDQQATQESQSSTSFTSFDQPAAQESPSFFGQPAQQHLQPSTSFSPLPTTPQRSSTSVATSSGKKSRLPLTRASDFNIRKLLEDHADGASILAELDEGQMPSVKNRKKLVQIVVADLVERGERGLHPTAEQKEALAEAVVTQFPSTKDTAIPGANGHEHFYNKGEGFIEWRFKTLRQPKVAQKTERSLKRKRKPQAGELEDLDEVEPTNDLLEKVEWLKYHPPTRENEGNIKRYFKDTASYRRAFITKNNPTITSTLEKFPRMKDMPSLINLDFTMMYDAEKADSFLTKWKVQLVEPILQLAKSRDDIDIDKLLNKFEDGGDRDMCALQVLALMIPSSNAYTSKGKVGRGAKGTSRVDSLTHLFQNRPVGTNVDSFRKEDRYTQPFILCLGPATKPQEFFLITDHIAIPAGKSTIEAFDMAFKVHYAFNVSYSRCLYAFYTFFAAVVYRCTNEIPPQVRAFNIMLNTNVKKK